MEFKLILVRYGCVKSKIKKRRTWKNNFIPICYWKKNGRNRNPSKSSLNIKRALKHWIFLQLCVYEHTGFAVPVHTCTAGVQQQPQGTARFKPVKSFSCFPSGGSFESFDFAAETLTFLMVLFIFPWILCVTRLLLFLWSNLSKTDNFHATNLKST